MPILHWLLVPLECIFRHTGFPRVSSGGASLQEFIVGVSIHAAQEGLTARSDGADFVTFGPVFTTPGKGDPQGLESLRSVCKLLDPFPVIALGGIDESNYRDVIENGAAGFAAIRFLNEKSNLQNLSELNSH